MFVVYKEKNVALKVDDIAQSISQAKLSINVDEIVKCWRSDLSSHPIGKFSFSAQTPPLKNMDIFNLLFF